MKASNAVVKGGGGHAPYFLGTRQGLQLQTMYISQFLVHHPEPCNKEKVLPGFKIQLLASTTFSELTTIQIPDCQHKFSNLVHFGTKNEVFQKDFQGSQLIKNRTFFHLVTFLFLWRVLMLAKSKKKTNMSNITGTMKLEQI